MTATLIDFQRQTGIRVVLRSQWGARSPRARHTIALPTPRLWIHHSADERQGESIRAHQDWHMDGRGWNDIAYSLLVDNHGTVYEGRGIGVAGGHTAGDNTSSHAICLLGNFENRPPTAAAEATVVALARYGRDHRWWVPTLGGHRDAPGANTACPGRYLYARLPELRRRVATTAPKPAPTPGGFLMALTDKEQKDLYGKVRAIHMLATATNTTVHDVLAKQPPGYWATGSDGVRYLVSADHTVRVPPGALQDWIRDLCALGGVTIPDAGNARPEAIDQVPTV